MFKEIVLLVLGTIIGSVSLMPYMQITITAFCALPELRGMLYIFDGIFDIRSCMAKFRGTLIINLIIVGLIWAAVLIFAPTFLQIGFFAWFGIFGASGIMKSGSSNDANRMEFGKIVSRYYKHVPGTEEVAKNILTNFAEPLQNGKELSEEDKAVFKHEHSILRIASCIHFVVCICVILFFVIS